MGVVSGVDIRIPGECGIRGSKVSYKGKARAFSASCFVNGAGRTLPVTDWMGEYWGYGYQPAVFPRDAITPFLYYGPAFFVSGPAFCLANIVRGSVEKGGPIEFVVKLGGNGALTIPTDTTTTTTTTTTATPPGIYDATAMKIATSLDGSDWTDETDVRDIVMEISCKDKPYSSSSTPRVTKRTVGHLDARVLWRTYEDSTALWPNPSAATNNHYVRVYVTDTLFWQFDTMRVTELEPEGDHESEENVGMTLLAEWNGLTDGTGFGQIINPATTVKWPA